MRSLADEETKLILEKLVKYIGKKATYYSIFKISLLI